MSSSAKISNEPKRDWLDLPSDVTADILKRIGVYDVLKNAQYVCTAWYKICKDPAIWRVIKIWLHERRMRKLAVDRSQGQLVDISIRDCNEELLSYVANRSRQLRRLELVLSVGDILKRLSGTLMKFPLLEELNLHLSRVDWKKEFIETAGRYCPMLKTLKVNFPWYLVLGYIDDEVAIATGENLHGLRHLKLFGNTCMSNIGLQAILDGCLCLETLDLRNCWNVDPNGDMGKRCFKQIKSLKLPNDSVEGSPCSYLYL